MQEVKMEYKIIQQLVNTIGKENRISIIINRSPKRTKDPKTQTSILYKT